MTRSDTHPGPGYVLLRAAMLLLAALGTGAGAQSPSKPPAEPPAVAPQPTQQQIHDTAQPPGFNVAHPDRDAGERPQPGVAGETPLDTAGAPSLPSTSTQASPVGRSGAKQKSAARRVGAAGPGTLAPGTAVRLHLAEEASSGKLRNGDTVQAVLAGAVRTTGGAVLAPGTPVVLTVVSAARAGVVQSGGVLSVELVRVGGIAVVSTIYAVDGKEGHKDVADSAPQTGSEATIAPGAVLTFTITA